MMMVMMMMMMMMITAIIIYCRNMNLCNIKLGFWLPSEFPVILNICSAVWLSLPLLIKLCS